ncbi:efflux RND transporter periplasmic adaptor subunit [Lunatibacter salilacus]|uniref:efflux RND transporter periplasmic adaptor subunit n=1 Tax=Lunatibacter salilacus TaxID=2483804 RepID=UPI00131E8304|nr:efflux RND transporter periplasmic adaptor subunit [Lunatibacter salilacus]
MKRYYTFLMIALAGFVISCSKENSDLDQKKKQLQEYQNEAAELKVKMDELSTEIAQLDPEFARSERKAVLVTTTQPKTGTFTHYVEVTGSVLSKKNVNISAEVAGRIQEVKAMEGMRVRKGEELAVIDAESVDRNIDELKGQLELATTIFEKQQRLWDQQIGTEVQFLEAKNRMENLEKSLATLNIQKDRTVVRAPFDGTVESVMVRLGELVQAGSSMFNFVGESDLYIEGDVSEKYVGVLQQGDSVQVVFPSIDKQLDTKVTAVGAVINPNNRTFKVEVFLPRMDLVKPNMLSVLRINDYQNKEAIVVPSYLILQDNQGDYVFVVENDTAKKKYVKRGMTQRDDTEIMEGLDGSETLIDKGFREVGNNARVNISR